MKEVTSQTTQAEKYIFYAATAFLFEKRKDQMAFHSATFSFDIDKETLCTEEVELKEKSDVRYQIILQNRYVLKRRNFGEWALNLARINFVE